MRLILNIVLIASLSYFAEMYFPWWIIVIVSFLVCFFIRVRSLNAFICGFLGVGLLWLGLAWRIHKYSEGVLSLKITTLFSLSDPLYLVVLTGLIGGLSGGFGALSGRLSYTLFARKNATSPTHKYA